MLFRAITDAYRDDIDEELDLIRVVNHDQACKLFLAMPGLRLPMARMASVNSTLIGLDHLVTASENCPYAMVGLCHSLPPLWPLRGSFWPLVGAWWVQSSAAPRPSAANNARNAGFYWL